MLTILPGGAGTEVVCAADMEHIASSDTAQVRIAFMDLSPSENVELENRTLRGNRISARVSCHFNP